MDPIGLIKYRSWERNIWQSIYKLVGKQENINFVKTDKEAFNLIQSRDKINCKEQQDVRVWDINLGNIRIWKNSLYPGIHTESVTESETQQYRCPYLASERNRCSCRRI